ncbi:hypothetical protein [Actibacterium sp. 188UL27-1]|uniref:hypothetical protein n=1 Tax=Actibacterium sp. 188UL27-1 TaxID=2786961 RepID=UPI001958EB96|nr:hypothetical protein [Actibacterium sp. 188UL27-1]MBM7066026.1 hypothetical protein [Actibacterium sp. 188UL27-1]
MVDPSVEDADGVQFATGGLSNDGMITGSEDGVEFVEDTVSNPDEEAVIRSTASESSNSSGVKISAIYNDGINPERPGGPVTILNEGPMVIRSEEGSTSAVLTRTPGRGGTAVQLAESQGNSLINIAGDRRILGDIVFGGGNDMFRILSTSV